MMAHDTLLQEHQAYKRASQLVSEWAGGAQALGLLRAALASGIFDTARTPSTPTQIASATGMEESQVMDILDALDAHQMVERKGDFYQLTPDFALLISPNAFQPLQDTLDHALAMISVLEQMVSGDSDYWSLPSAYRLALAKGVTGNPASPIVPPLIASVISTVPELQALYEGGARHLELGCGVGGNLLGLLLTYPKLTGVGVEIAADVLAEAQRRADTLGVADRVDLRHCDARNLDEDAVFDIVFWGQFFFPSDSRAAVLNVAYRALKPAGHLYVPVLGQPPSSIGALRASTGRAYMVRRVIYGSWGIPALSAEALRSEVEAAGFEFVRLVPTSSGQRVLARRPAS
jgi:SAM-dependent methyltransferase